MSHEHALSSRKTSKKRQQGRGITRRNLLFRNAKQETKLPRYEATERERCEACRFYRGRNWESLVQLLQQKKKQKQRRGETSPTGNNLSSNSNPSHVFYTNLRCAYIRSGAPLCLIAFCGIVSLRNLHAYCTTVLRLYCHNQRPMQNKLPTTSWVSQGKLINHRHVVSREPLGIIF